MKHIALLLLLLPLSCSFSTAQEATTYPFIRYQRNTLHYNDNSSSLTTFFQKWKRLVTTGQGKGGTLSDMSSISGQD